MPMDTVKRYAKTQRSREFLTSVDGQWAYDELMKMVNDENYKTESSYSPASEGGVLLFIDKHMSYLCCHLSVKPLQYVSNLQLITKINR